eukprot:SAG11_NODE_2402_length_3400_cov_4.019691_2_plen_204_part_00
MGHSWEPPAATKRGRRTAWRGWGRGRTATGGAPTPCATQHMRNLRPSVRYLFWCRSVEHSEMILWTISGNASMCRLCAKRLLHASSPNYSDSNERRVIFIGYGYRWLRSKDVMDVEQAMCSDAARCPVRVCAVPSSHRTIDVMPFLCCVFLLQVTKQMLGWTHTNNGIFSPLREDVPLFGFMERCGAIDENVGLDTYNHGNLA